MTNQHPLRHASLDRRRFVALLATPAVASLAGLLQACGSDSGTTTPTTGNGTDPEPTTAGQVVNGQSVGLLRSDVSRAPGGDPAAAAAAINGLSADLFGALHDPARNLLFSPASITIALAMTRAGAAGQTATQMDEVLHIADPAAIGASMNGLQLALDARTRTEQSTTGQEAVTLSVANSLWGQVGYQFEQAFLDTLAADYGTGIELVDYRNATEAARTAINAWVAEQTRERITELLGAGVLTEAVRLTLVNTIYLKAPWATRFDAAESTKMPFTSATAGNVTATMMHKTAYFDYAGADGWQAVALPYSGGELSMLVLLPDDTDADLASVATNLEAASGAMTSRRVAVSLPRWDFSSQTELSDALRALGMTDAFDPASADFSGMSVPTAEPLSISKVIHEANITVDEDGTEAAAATAVIGVATSAPGDLDEPVEFVVDRPFIFAVRDNATGALLFVGSVGDPTQA